MDLDLEELDWDRMREEEDAYFEVVNHPPALIGSVLGPLLARIEELARKTKLTPKGAKNWYRDVYLRSEWWKDVREATVERDEHRCRVCNSQHKIQVHHRSYDNLWHEKPEDLITLCCRCHKLFHDNGRLAKPPGK